MYLLQEVGDLIEKFFNHGWRVREEIVEYGVEVNSEGNASEMMMFGLYI